MSYDKPILGFGAIGWIAAAILATLIVLVICGADIQFEYLKLLDRAFGSDFVLWYVSRIHVWHGLTLNDAIFGLPLVCLTIIALRIAPRRIAWWKYSLVIVMGLTQPVLFRFERTWVMEFWALLSGKAPDPYAIRVATSILVNIIACAVLWIVTRSLLVLAGGLIASLLVGSYASWQCLITPAGYQFFPTPGFFDFYIGPFWNLAIATCLFWWAIRDRQQDFGPGHCAACGYDLRGVAHERCPECGKSVVTATPVLT